MRLDSYYIELPCFWQSNWTIEGNRDACTLNKERTVSDRFYLQQINMLYHHPKEYKSYHPTKVKY